MQRALRLLHWASAWLVDQFRKRVLEEQDARLARLALAMDIVATAMQRRQFAPSALAVANELAGRLACDRVSIGLEKSGSIEVRAISHTATFDPKMDLGRRIGEVCGRHLQSPCLELGGKNPMVVTADADLDLAVEGALFGGFGTAGQRCTSLGTLIVDEKVH